MSHRPDGLSITRNRLFTNPSFCYSLFVGRIADCSDAPALLKSSYHMPAVALSVYTSPGLFSSAENCVSNSETRRCCGATSGVGPSTMRHASCTIVYPCARRQQMRSAVRFPFLPDGNDITRKRGK